MQPLLTNQRMEYGCVPVTKVRDLVFFIMITPHCPFIIRGSVGTLDVIKKMIARTFIRTTPQRGAEARVPQTATSNTNLMG